MELITKVDIAEPQKRLSYKNKMMIVGSCFANEVGSILKSYSFDISINPFGTLYNPVSILNSLERMNGNLPFDSTDVVDISLHSTEGAAQPQKGASKGDNNARYCSFFHHSSFARESDGEFLKYANEQLAEASAAFKECDTIIITLGTSWVFRHIPSGKIVSNCHKITPKEFKREFLSCDETSALFNNFIARHPDKNFIFTVSPIRHLKDGAHGNQISKSSLLLAIEKILKTNPHNTYYFPAYEIVLDELRDYRFYAEDMVHPSEVAVKYIFEKFKEHCIDEQSYSEMARNLKAYKQENHRRLL